VVPGVFSSPRIAAGIDGHGIDEAPEMVDVALRRLGSNRVRFQRMQDISDENAYDVVCASRGLSTIVKRNWSFIASSGVAAARSEVAAFFYCR